MRIVIIAALSLLLGLQNSKAQTIENVRATVQNEFIIIQYDLRTVIPDQEFTISLFASTNNFSQALNQVSGDVGPNIKPGNGKSISWAAKSELGTDFKGQISFEVRGLPIVVNIPYIIYSPTAGTKTKKTKEMLIEWSGGKTNDEVTFQLFQNSASIGTIAKTSNTGRYSWLIPKTVKKGDYQIMLNAEGSIALSMPFTIKSKGGLLKVLPIFILGGAAYFIFSDKTGPEGPGTPANNDLPAAPDPD